MSSSPAQRALAIEIQNIINDALRSRKVTRAELARRMGTSRAHVTQMLDDDRNLTINTIAKALDALDLTLYVEAR